jgi:hypothetical protein
MVRTLRLLRIAGSILMNYAVDWSYVPVVEEALRGGTHLEISGIHLQFIGLD